MRDVVTRCVASQAAPSPVARDREQGWRRGQPYGEAGATGGIRTLDLLFTKQPGRVRQLRERALMKRQLARGCGIEPLGCNTPARRGEGARARRSRGIAFLSSGAGLGTPLVSCYTRGASTLQNAAADDRARV